MTLWQRILALFGATYVRIDGEVHRVRTTFGIPTVYLGGRDRYALPLRDDGTAGYFSSCRWEHVGGPRLV